MMPFTRLAACGAVIGMTPIAPPVSAATGVFCSPFIPHTVVVGDKAHDAQCDAQTIQDAVTAAVCPNTTIYLTAEESYLGQHVTIQDQSLLFVGSTATSCSAATSAPASPASIPTSPVTTIHGDGSHSVFTIGGTSTVTFRYIEITGGGGGSGSHGGGIDFNGTGSLTLDTTLIDLNSANFGGGIEFNGSGGNATLTLLAHSVIESNTASGNGGGINVEGRGRLIAVEPFTTIGFNHAPNGKGGGVAVVDPGSADLGSSGYGGVPLINGNDAALGGGISAQGASNGQGYVSLFTTDPHNPITVSGNFASTAGGGIYLLPSSDASPTGIPILLCASDFRIDGNSAPDGTAIYADHSPDNNRGGAIVLNRHLCSEYLSTACATNLACNSMSNNIAQDGDNHPKPGSTVVAYYADVNSLMLDRFAMRGNTGLHAIRTTSASATIRYCLVAGNTLSGEMISLEDDGSVAAAAAIVNCTIAGNAHNSGSTIHSEHTLYLDNSILGQVFMSSMSFSGYAPVSASHILAADPTGLPAQPDIVQGQAIFRGALTGIPDDYHQAAFAIDGVITASLGIDAAPSMQDTNPDLDGNPYDRSVAGVGSLSDPRDLGCYEAQPISDRVFADAFGNPVSLVY